MNNTPTNPCAGHPTLPAPQNRLYRWRMVAPETNHRIQIIAHTPAEARRIFSRLYGVAVAVNARFVI